MENQMKGVYVDQNYVLKYIEYPPEPPQAEDFGRDYEVWIDYNMKLAVCMQDSIEIINGKEITRAVMLEKLAEMNKAGFSWEVSLKPGHIYPLPEGYLVHKLTPGENVCLSHPLVSLRKTATQTLEEEFEMERQLLHMKIEMRFYIWHAEVEENWKIFAERFRISPRPKLQRIMTHHQIISFLRSISGVQEVYAHIIPQGYQYHYCLALRHYKQSFLNQEIRFDIASSLYDSLPITAAANLQFEEDDQEFIVKF